MTHPVTKIRRMAELIEAIATRAGLSAPPEGRILYAGLQALPVPVDPVAKVWHTS